jgi:hypothetical protein
MSSTQTATVALWTLAWPRAARFAHDVDGVLHCADIGVEAEAAFGRGRVLPADGEGLQAVLDGERNDALFGHQIEDIELVDLRRSDQERPLVHLASDGPVLDQLHHVVAVHHRARSRRQILADGEFAGIDLRRQAAVAGEVAEKIFQAMQDAGAPGIDEFLQCGGIACERIGRRHRVDEQRGDEARALGVARVQLRRVN